MTDTTDNFSWFGYGMVELNENNVAESPLHRIDHFCLQSAYMPYLEKNPL